MVGFTPDGKWPATGQHHPVALDLVPVILAGRRFRVRACAWCANRALCGSARPRHLCRRGRGLGQLSGAAAGVLRGCGGLTAAGRTLLVAGVVRMASRPTIAHGLRLRSGAGGLDSMAVPNPALQRTGGLVSRFERAGLHGPPAAELCVHTSVPSTYARKLRSAARCGIYERVPALRRSGSPIG